MSATDLSRTLNTFRTIAFWEGVSFVVLIFVGMPLKYFADLAIATKLIGWPHGILFILYVIYLVISARKANWSAARIALFFLAALIPFAAFYAERSVKKEQKM